MFDLLINMRKPKSIGFFLFFLLFYSPDFGKNFCFDCRFKIVELNLYRHVNLFLTMKILEKQSEDVVSIYIEKFSIRPNPYALESLKEKGKEIPDQLKKKKVKFLIEKKILEGEEAKEFIQKILNYDYKAMEEEQFLRAELGSYFLGGTGSEVFYIVIDKDGEKVRRSVGSDLIGFHFDSPEFPKTVRLCKEFSEEVSLVSDLFPNTEGNIQEAKIFNEIKEVRSYLMTKQLKQSYDFLNEFEIRLKEIEMEIIEKEEINQE